MGENTTRSRRKGILQVCGTAAIILASVVSAGAQQRHLRAHIWTRCTPAAMARDGSKSENDCYATEEAVVGIVLGDEARALFEKCETEPLISEHIRQCDALEARVEIVDRDIEDGVPLQQIKAQQQKRKPGW